MQLGPRNRLDLLQVDPDHPALAPLSFEVLAKRDGIVSGIDNQQVARLARLAGAPKVQGAGVDLLCKLGDTVKEGQTLCIIEAMKLLNEIEADKAGVIKDVLVENGQAVDPTTWLSPR